MVCLDHKLVVVKYEALPTANPGMCRAVDICALTLSGQQVISGETLSQGCVVLIVQSVFAFSCVTDFCFVSGGQRVSPESLRYSPRHSSSIDSAAYISISLPELPADYSSGRMAAPSPLAPLAAHTLTPALVTPGAAAMPPSLAARYSIINSLRT